MKTYGDVNQFFVYVAQSAGEMSTLFTLPTSSINPSTSIQEPVQNHD